MVLYGGVSLAVYENGVAQELYRSIRGDGIYGLVKELTDSDIVVDIISGTSAGGVNGVMLGYALANCKDFIPVADLWRNEADIQKLLRAEGDENAFSVLDSNYYQDRLRECFQSLNNTPAKPGPFPSEIMELDLFVTGTDANGAVSTVFDDSGHAVDVKNHRTLFKLAYRGGRSGESEKNDFKNATADDLAKLCRLTSCFPVAFEPVRVESKDTAFYRWGKLRCPAVYLDGGILNNKPFTSTIEDISRRTANRDVERFVIYVEPKPEVFKLNPDAFPASPNVAQAAFGALVSIPGYQSIAGDLAALEAHNERVESLSAVLAGIGPPNGVASAAFHGGQVYAQAAVHDPYYECRLIQLRDAAVEGILNDDKGRGYIGSKDDRGSACILVASFDHWRGPFATTLQDFDVYYRMRRGERLSNTLMEHVKRNGHTKALEHAWNVVNHYFKLFEILKWSLHTSLDAFEFGWKELGNKYPDLDLKSETEQDQILSQISQDTWGQVEKRLLTILDIEGIAIPVKPDQAARAKFYRDLSSRFGGAVRDKCKGNLLHELDCYLESELRGLPDGDIGNLLRGEYARFLDVDRQLFPIRFGAGNQSVDAIRVVRFSPKDAQRGFSQGDPAKKVCGGTLAAFGGFFKKTWRANDITMGRLDAVCQLLECLVTRVRLAQVHPKPHFTAHKVKNYLHKLSDAQANALAAALNDYLAVRDTADEDQWNRLIDALVGVAQAAIVAEEWPKVLKCALDQEYLWSQYHANEVAPPEPYDRKNLKWIPAKRRPDSVLVAVAAEAIAKGLVPPFEPGQIAGHPFGEEIPEPVLTELALLCSMRISKSLLASAPNASVRAKLEGNPLYTWVSGRILPSLYYWTRIRRTRPDMVIVLSTILPVMTLTLMLLSVVFALHPFGWVPPWQVIAALFAAAFLLLLLWWFLLRRFT
jgi:predicted acylesterase/phospholipase RssA